MVVKKMMRWPPWPAAEVATKKYTVVVVVRRLQGLELEDEVEEERRALVVEVKWKGQKKSWRLGSAPPVKRNFTKEGGIGDDGVVEWDEEFTSVCRFSGYKEEGEPLFFPWELAFTVLFNAENKGVRNRVSVFGTASLNLAEYALAASVGKEFGLNIPVNVATGVSETIPSLSISLRLLELRATQQLSETMRGSPHSDEAISAQKDEFSALKAGLRKVKILTNYVSFGKSNKACCEEGSTDSRSSNRSEDASSNYPFDTSSLDDDAGEESDCSKDDSSVRRSISYKTIAYANYAGALFYSNTNIDNEDDFWIHYSNHKLAGGLHVENSSAPVHRPTFWRSSMGSILPWRKRKLSFRSPKAKEEPLLKKHYGEEGGDDIDFDRRQLSSSDESSFGQKEVISRDGNMRLHTQVFFASIDQRSERAAGESACTALVAVIADWLKSNQDEMPIKSEFDSLIRDGSSEWRALCNNEAYIEHFPDKHFDLDTIVQSKVRPLSLVPEKSFVGFFHPEGLENKDFDFLDGAMSFDSIWDEIGRSASECAWDSEPLVYIVSWNDHFFVLRVEQHAFYIIDTLGERLYEGCNHAYILKFDKDTVIQRLPSGNKTSDEKKSDQLQPNNSKETKAKGAIVVSQKDSKDGDGEEEIVWKGKDCCKEYIKSFLAAIPIRGLLADLKRGLMTSIPLHHRLQIEFHYTKLLLSPGEVSVSETAADAPAMAMALTVV
ncbi:uncharacterized protein LOC126584268 isoform X2 [Malus sylvestris]|uniref:uncharacterized protein LOC126584268 isoform X2 n=1 Tax=Malus sylvestris TaxID=3752 RepID=UPI0021AC87CA|nr:uncharacterized protein LOC126584268 isoform X2 [Malus sylvestris]